MLVNRDGSRALLLVKLRRPERAKAYLERAIAQVTPGDANANRRLHRLSWAMYGYLGDWQRAFAELECSYRSTWQHAVPLWNGERLHGPLVVFADGATGFGGFGDIILFLRYLHPLAERAGEMVLALRPGAYRSIGPLLRRVDYVEFTSYADLPTAAAWLPLELAPVYAVPEPVPYLYGHVVRPRAPFNVVMNWAGGVCGTAVDLGQDSLTQEHRTVPLRAWTPVLGVCGVRFVSVQQRRTVPPRYAELGFSLENGEPPNGVDDRGPGLRHWRETAEIVSTADLVITSDTAVAHLAGALARPVWILLSATSAPYWEITGEHSVWYPTARLFRQRELGMWDPVMADVANELNRIVSRRSGQQLA